MATEAIRVLLVEHDSVRAERLRNVLSAWSDPIELHEAHNLSEARAQLQDTTCDLVVAQWHLPDGLISELQAIPSPDSFVPVIALLSEQQPPVSTDRLETTPIVDWIEQSQYPPETLPYVVCHSIQSWQDCGSRYAASDSPVARHDFDKLLDGLEEGFFSLNRNLEITHFNRMAEEHLGKKASEVVGTRLFDEAFPEARHSVFEEQFTKAMETREPVDFDTYFHWRGEIRWFVVRVRPSTFGLHIFFRVTTEKNRAEELLRLNLERFRKCHDPGLIGTAITSPHTHCLEVNDRLCEILGRSREELMQRTWGEITHPEDWTKEEPLLDRVLRGDEEGYSLDKRLLHPSGESIDVAVATRCLRNPQGEVERLITIVQDLREQHRTEAEARAAQEALLEQQRREQQRVQAELEKLRAQLVRQTQLATIGQLSAMIAHELRNPLGAVRNASYLLKRKIPADDAKLQRYVAIVENETVVAEEILNELVAMYRGKAPVRKPCSLAAIVTEARSRVTAPDSIAWRFQYDADPFVIHVDAAQLEQVLRNLFQNAIQAMSAKGTITLNAHRTEEFDVITVTDTGPGIPTDLGRQVFEPLFTTRPRGTGLGLTICRQIVERHGGMIDAVPSSQGAALQLHLPRQPADESTVTHQSLRKDGSGSRPVV